MQLKSILASFLLVISLLSPCSLVKAESSSMKELPFSGYYLAPEASSIEGLLFQENQLIIYIKDESGYAHPVYGHDHEDNYDNEQQDVEKDIKSNKDHHDDTIDQEFIEWLFEFNAYPYPDLKNYSISVQERYKKENNLPINLKEVYLAIVDQITPEMTQRNILDLINQTIPDISYTQKNDYNYFTISCPTITVNNDHWTVQLFGEEIFSFVQQSGQLIDNHGNTYEYIDGIKPN
ncbi:hypothetical protein ACQV2Q_00410 [Facklamia sp. P12950]